MSNIDFVVDSKIDFVVDSKIYFLVDSQIYFVVDSKIVFVSVRPKIRIGPSGHFFQIWFWPNTDRIDRIWLLLVYKIPYRRAPRLAFRPSASREQRYLAYNSLADF